MNANRRPPGRLAVLLRKAPPAFACAALLASLHLPLAAQTDAYIGQYYDGVGHFDGASTNTPGFISLFGTTGVTFGPDGYLYVGTDSPGSVNRYDTSGNLVGTFIAYTGDAHGVSNPQGMHFGPDGNLYIADVTGGNVQVFDSNGAWIDSLTAAGNPVSLAFRGSTLFVSSQGSIERYSGSTYTSIILAGSIETPTPQVPGISNFGDLTFGPDGNLYALDVGATYALWKFTIDGSDDVTAANMIVDFNAQINSDYLTPAGLAFDSSGKVFVSGSALFGADDEVWQFDTNGTFDGVFASGLAHAGFLAFAPTAISEPADSALLVATGLLPMAWPARRRLFPRGSRPPATV